MYSVWRRHDGYVYATNWHRRPLKLVEAERLCDFEEWGDAKTLLIIERLKNPNHPLHAGIEKYREEVNLVA